MTDNEALSAKAISLISHKLRTPLSIINGYSEAVLSQAEKESFSPFTTKALEEINKQGSRMSCLVDKLMAFNQVITADAQHLEKKPVALKELIKECASKVIARDDGPLPTQQVKGVKRGTFVEIDCSTQLTFVANADMYDWP